MRFRDRRCRTNIELKIKELRRRAEQSLGARFDIKGSRAVVEDGALCVLEEKIDRFARQASAADLA